MALASDPSLHRALLGPADEGADPGTSRSFSLIARGARQAGPAASAPTFRVVACQHNAYLNAEIRIVLC